jgi:hypothetical protein
MSWLSTVAGQVGIVVGDAVLVGEVVLDRGVAVLRADEHERGQVRREQATVAVVPGPRADPIDRVDDVAGAVVGRGQKRPPRLAAGARHRPLGDRRAQLVGAAQPGARAGLAEAQVAAEAQRVVRQLLQRAQAGDEEREVRQGRVDRGVGGGGVVGAAPSEGDGGGTGEDGSAHGTSGRERRKAR